MTASGVTASGMTASGMTASVVAASGVTAPGLGASGAAATDAVVSGTAASESTGTLVVISLAPALDRYARAATFQRGAINRPRSVKALAGGKGLNAARTAVRLGVPTRTVALIGGSTADAMRKLADAENLAVTWVDSGVETRQCLSLLDESDGSMTEVYEAVLPVPAEVWPAILSAVHSQLTGLSEGDVVAISGRVPDGLPDDAIAQLVGLCAGTGVPVMVDSDGEQLARAARRRPTLVKVNAGEAAAATGTDPEQPWVAAKALQALGAETVVITLGPGGALCLTEDGQRFEVRHDPLEHALPVGSGDAFLAALAVRRLTAFRPPTIGTPPAGDPASGSPSVGGLVPDTPVVAGLTVGDAASGGGLPVSGGPASGDAAVRGLARSRAVLTDLPEALRYAAAAGRANARYLEAGSCTPAALSAELPSISLHTL